MVVEYSDTLHDRQVVFDSGWVVKIGRGLDIYKPPEGKMALGAFDLKLRKFVLFELAGRLGVSMLF